MQTADIEREIRGFLIQHFLSGRDEKLRDDGSLLGDLIDSAGTLELIAYLQEHFAITVEDEEVVPGNLDTVNSLVAFVSRKLGARV